MSSPRPSCRGRGPDVALFVPEQTVINLAVRGALADFSDDGRHRNGKGRFHPSALVAAGWNGGLYALPETQTWFMLFCRTDILSGLGLDIPDTWDELYHVLQVLRQRNMLVGVPRGRWVYEMLLLQRGGQVFNTDLTATDMEATCLSGAFAAWTDFFVKAFPPVAYDFTTGSVPAKCPSASSTIPCITSCGWPLPKSAACGKWRRCPASR